MTARDPSLSEPLQRFIAEAPKVREPHIEFLNDVRATLHEGSTVIDIGAGDAPYRELFEGLNYRTCDWENSIYQPTQPPDYVANAIDLPFDSDSIDGIVCTQVLEHVAEPWLAFDEFIRVLRPGGSLWVTTPFVWFIHEAPYDFYRYTSYGLRFLAERSGFDVVDVKPMGSSMATVSQVGELAGWLLGRSDDGRNGERDLVDKVGQRLAQVFSEFSDLDFQWILPLCYSMKAQKPSGSSESSSTS